MKDTAAPIIVVPISPDPNGKVNGIGTYCHALSQLFEDCEEVRVTPPLNCKVRESRLVNLVFGWRSLYTTMKATKADVVHVNGYTAFNVFQSLVMARLLRKRIVYTAHWHPFRMLRRPLLGKVFFYVMIRPFLGLPHRIVTIIRRFSVSPSTR